MRRQELLHLEHGAAVLPEYGLQLVVGNDRPLVGGVLQLVLADVIPDLGHDLGAGQRVGADDRSELGRGCDGLRQSAGLPGLFGCGGFGHLIISRGRAAVIAVQLQIKRGRTQAF